MDIWKFERRRGQWHTITHGGGAAVPRYPLTHRAPAAAQGGHLRCRGAGRTIRNARVLFPWQHRYLHHARLYAAAEVAQVRIGTRLLPVPAHGNLVVVWSTRPDPTVEAIATDRTLLASVDLEREPILHPPV